MAALVQNLQTKDAVAGYECVCIMAKKQPSILKLTLCYSALRAGIVSGWLRNVDLFSDDLSKSSVLRQYTRLSNVCETERLFILVLLLKTVLSLPLPVDVLTRQVACLCCVLMPCG
jgi:hypothetical protein